MNTAPRESEQWARLALQRLDESDPLSAASGIAAALHATEQGSLPLELGKRLGQALARRGEPIEAGRLLDALCRGPDSDADVHAIRARLQLELGQPDGALETLRHGLTLWSSDRGLRRLYGTASAACGLDGEAETIWRNLLDELPDEPSLRHEFAELLLRNDRAADAVEVLEPVVLRHGSDVRAWILLADAYHRTGGHEMARNGLRKATALAGDTADHWRRIGELFERMEATADALAAFERAVELEPSVEGLRGLARVRDRIGDRDGAIDALVKAAARSDDPELKRQLTLLLRPDDANASSQPIPVTDGTVLAGDLSSFSLPQAIEFLKSQESTGRLCAHSEGSTAILTFARGRIVEVSIERPGRAPRVCSDEEAALAVLLELIDWGSGQFEFKSCPTAPTGDLELDPMAALLEVCRRKDEASGAHRAQTDDDAALDDAFDL